MSTRVNIVVSCEVAMDRIRVFVQTSDPITRLGLGDLLRDAPEIELTASPDADVIVLAEDRIGRPQLGALWRARQEAEGGAVLRGVLVTHHFDPGDVLAAVQYGVLGVLPAAHVSAHRLVSVLTGVVAGRAYLPQHLQAAFLEQLHRLRHEHLAPQGLTFSSFDARELDVLNLLSEGFRTDEIATKLAYSEGTVKSVLYGLVTRLKLKNRTHAVAYAIRTGALRAEASPATWPGGPA
ncbi:LuxR C-terminal-related transcriptional regulator [Amycolatopsis sp. NPDC059027]|uniref:helix-turn-helix transcriptional regulator n=1 Tax=Amycolatopsis sp. NPDC059027 TaxID=3346709 RepID=UPI003671A8B8